MLKFLLNGFRIMVDTLLYILVFFILVLTVPRLFGFSYITIQSGSMLPVLEVGSACIISEDKDDYKHLTRQDIITYKMADETGAFDTDETILITHRVKCINGDGTYTTQGDNNDAPDIRRVDPSQIVGVVRFHVPYMGYALDHLNSGLAKGILAAVIAVLVIASLLLDTDSREERRAANGDSVATSSMEMRYRRQSKKVAAVGLAARSRAVDKDSESELDGVTCTASSSVKSKPTKATAKSTPVAASGAVSEMPRAVKAKKAGGALSLEAAMARKSGLSAPVDPMLQGMDYAIPDAMVGSLDTSSGSDAKIAVETVATSISKSIPKSIPKAMPKAVPKAVAKAKKKSS